MLAVARAKVPATVGVKQARAESLPFKDASFDAVVMTLVVHHLDRPRAFAELHRVLDEEGRLSITTFQPQQFDAHYLGELFPSIPVVDRKRFGTPEQLADGLRDAGFERVELVRLRQETAATREYVLERIRGRHISTFQLVPEDEYAAGLARAERELPARVPVEQYWLVVTAVRANG